MTTRISLIFTLSLYLSICVNSQTIECVGEYHSGDKDSYINSSTMFGEEIFFIDSDFALIKYNDATNSYSKIDDESNSFYSIFDVMSNDDAVFYTGRYFVEDRVYMTDGTAAGASLVEEFAGTINQKTILSKGLAVIEEDESTNFKSGYFIDNTGADPMLIMEDIDIGFKDFAISESQNLVIISPEDEEDDDTGVFFFDTDTGMTLTDDLVIPDACGKVTEARGFQDFIFYECDNKYRLYSHDTQSSSSISISSEEIRAFGETTDYIFIAFTFGRLYSINKATLSSKQIATDLAVFPEFTIHDESVYYVNNGKINSHDGNSATVYSSDFGDNDVVIRAETLNSKVHVLVEPSGFGDFELMSLDAQDEVAELITEVDLFTSSQAVFHYINESIIYAHNDDMKGQEFFRLSYAPDATQDEIDLSGISISPNPVSEMLSLEFESGISPSSYRITNLYGQQLKSDYFSQHIDVTELRQGTYMISLYGDREAIATIKFVKH